MKILNMSIELSSNDLEILVNKFIDKQRLIINSILLDNNITIKGTLPIKSLTFPFYCELKITSVIGSLITINIISFSTLNIILPSKVRDMALKTLLSLISINGVTIKEKVINIELKNVLSEMKLSNLEIIELFPSNNRLYLTINNLCTERTLDDLLA